jgi:hypothetical protein
MRAIKYIVALSALAAAGHAACEFPYYPEFADVFSQYDEVTPAMAIAGIGAWPEEATTFVEPLLLRDANGMPYCYMIEAFPADEAELVARWNEVVAKLNAGARLPAAELAAELAALYAVEYAPFRFGEALKNVAGVADELSAEEAESLNEVGVNCVREIGDGGVAVCGARTLSTYGAYKYVAVRRLLIYLERSIKLGTRWVVREPNDERVWARVRRASDDFLAAARASGALKGATAEEAYFVRCGPRTMTEADIAEGRVAFDVGVAPREPGEFVIFRVTQAETYADVREL